ncbi:ABC transporter ATP-binding protein, partial [Paenibacillus glucanolyticus]
LSEIQLLCSRVAIISSGRVLAVGEVDELIAGNSDHVIWDLNPAVQGKRILQKLDYCEIVNHPEEVLDDNLLAGMSPEAVVTRISSDNTSRAVERLVSGGVQVREVHRINPTLEQLFLQMTEGESIE